MFGQVRNSEVPEWRAPHDLSGLIEEIFLDEAQNARVWYPHPIVPLRSLTDRI
jgi:hypothetical protein